jgi:hypothetical protein
MIIENLKQKQHISAFLLKGKQSQLNGLEMKALTRVIFQVVLLGCTGEIAY